MELAKRPITVVEGVPRVSEPARVEEVRSASTGQGQEALQDVVCGSLAGIVGKYIEYPFDTVKVRLQSQPDHLPLQYNGPLDCFKKSLSRDGFFGIYRGISAPLVGAAVETSCLFFSVSLARAGHRRLENFAYRCHSTAWPKMLSRQLASILSWPNSQAKIYLTQQCSTAEQSLAQSRHSSSRPLS